MEGQIKKEHVKFKTFMEYNVFLYYKACQFISLKH